MLSRATVRRCCKASGQCANEGQVWKLMADNNGRSDDFLQDYDGDDRVMQILSEAARLFASKGYEGASMRDIAVACGISKSLLYHHFANKEEIYSRVAVGATMELYLFVRARIPEGRPPVEKIRAFMLATAEYFRRYRWAWIASTNAFWNDPDRHRKKDRLMRRDRYEHYLRSLIQEAIDAGEFRKVDVAMAGRLILSSLNWMHRWYNPKKPATPEDIAAIYFDILVDGLRGVSVTGGVERASTTRARKSTP